MLTNFSSDFGINIETVSLQGNHLTYFIVYITTLQHLFQESTWITDITSSNIKWINKVNIFLSYGIKMYTLRVI